MHKISKVSGSFRDESNQGGSLSNNGAPTSRKCKIGPSFICMNVEMLTTRHGDSATVEVARIVLEVAAHERPPSEGYGGKCLRPGKKSGCCCIDRLSRWGWGWVWPRDVGDQITIRPSHVRRLLGNSARSTVIPAFLTRTPTASNSTSPLQSLQ